MAGLLGDDAVSTLMAALYKPPRRKVFVSYHHGGDQGYYNEFSRFFHDQFEAVFDNSLERQIESDNVDYVMQRIRDNHLTGTSCTIVLIGAQTYQRKYVDWEIKATLDKQHGLFGIVLPTHIQNQSGQIIVPDRFNDNVNSGYAVWTHWHGLTVQRFTELLNASIAKPTLLIDNSRAMRQRNG
ncbi:MAG: TIR domain-containing protein [Gammaproteobacteria bacterium]|nr:TIR domain-containing protein [Gammaproteobacteria bacterium]MBU1415200.1 TIR domain-containing protein [Gammaproteobacteria bacterium]